MLTHLLKRANQLGWQLSTSLDVSAKYISQENGPDYPLDVHSWFFRKKFSTQPADQLSAQPTPYPSIQPSIQPSNQPSGQPRAEPSAPPLEGQSSRVPQERLFQDYTYSDLPPSYDEVMNS